MGQDEIKFLWYNWCIVTVYTQEKTERKQVLDNWCYIYKHRLIKV